MIMFCNFKMRSPCGGKVTKFTEIYYNYNPFFIYLRMRMDKSYYSNGQLRKLCYYKNGLLHGAYNIWQDDGRLWEDCFYKNGLLHGEYYYTGYLTKHRFYKNGELHGEYKYWDEDGVLRKHCFYKNGELHGEFIEWFHSGLIETHCFYKNGKCHGEYYNILKYYSKIYYALYENDAVLKSENM